MNPTDGETPGAWVVTNIHRHCRDCKCLTDDAIALAKCTGIKEGRYQLNRHGVDFVYETYEQRREALRMSLT